MQNAKRNKAPASESYNAGALAFAFVLLVMLGLCLGLAGHAIGFNRPHGKLFPILIGLPLAVAAAPLVWRHHVSRRWACVCVVAGSLAAYGHQHSLEFREFSDEFASRLLRVLEGQALQEIIDDFEALSRSVDQIAKGAEGLSEKQRDQITAARNSRDAFAGEMREMKAAADKFAGEGRNRDLAPLLRRHQKDWDRLRDRIEEGGVGQMGLGEESTVEGDELATREVRNVLRSFGFGEYLASKAEQGARLNFFGKEIVLGRGATIAWWNLEIVLASLMACLLVGRVTQSRDLREALGHKQK